MSIKQQLEHIAMHRPLSEAIRIANWHVNSAGVVSPRTSKGTTASIAEYNRNRAAKVHAWLESLRK